MKIKKKKPYDEYTLSQRESFHDQLERWKRDTAKPEYGLPAIKIWNSIGKVTRQEYLESMLEMEEKFPGRGWKEAVDDLEKFYFDNNLPLNDFRTRGPMADTLDKVLGKIFK